MHHIAACAGCETADRGQSQRWGGCAWLGARGRMHPRCPSWSSAVNWMPSISPGPSHPGGQPYGVPYVDNSAGSSACRKALPACTELPQRLSRKPVHGSWTGGWNRSLARQTLTRSTGILATEPGPAARSSWATPPTWLPAACGSRSATWSSTRWWTSSSLLLEALRRTSSRCESRLLPRAAGAA